ELGAEEAEASTELVQGLCGTLRKQAALLADGTRRAEALQDLGLVDHGGQVAAEAVMHLPREPSPLLGHAQLSGQPIPLLQENALPALEIAQEVGEGEVQAAVQEEDREVVEMAAGREAIQPGDRGQGSDR